MRKILLLLSFVLCFTSVLGQETPSIKYFKDFEATRELQKKGPYLLETIQINDSLSQQTFSFRKNKKKIWVKSFVNGKPYGIWYVYAREKSSYKTIPDTLVVYNSEAPKNIYPADELKAPGEKDKNYRAIMDHIKTNFRYPRFALESGFQGSVRLQFVVNELGQVIELSVFQSRVPSLDMEAYRIISLLKELEPFKVDGKKVRVCYNLPINFRLQ